ncbi:MAG: TlpA family protein disulfide reductase [Pseudomonadales bacterium]
MTPSRLPLFSLALLLLIGPLSAHSEQVSSFPTFQLQTNTGIDWALEDYDGQPKLVMFWATWCPYCKRMFPTIKNVHAQYSEQGLKVVAVNFRDKGDTVAYAHRHGLSFDIVLNGDQLAKEVGVLGTPTVFLLDSNNEVQYRTSNSDPEDPKLRKAVATLLEGASP